MRVMRMVFGVLPVLLVGLCGCGNNEEKVVDVDEALESFMHEKGLRKGKCKEGVFVFSGSTCTKKAETKHTLRFASIANALSRFAEYIDIDKKGGERKVENHIDGDMLTRIYTASADLGIGELRISYNRCLSTISVMSREGETSGMCDTTSLLLDGKCVVKVIESEVNDVGDVQYAVDSGLTWAMLENALNGSRHKIALLYEMSGMSRDGEHQYGVVLGIKVTNDDSLTRRPIHEPCPSRN